MALSTSTHKESIFENKYLSLGKYEDKFVVTVQDAVAVLVENVETGLFTFVKQKRIPPILHGISEPLLEIPAGKIDAGETPREAAIREAFEETGYNTEKFLNYLGKFFPSPGVWDEVVYLYYAKVYSKDKLASGGGIDNENITVVELSAREILDYEILDGKTLIALYKIGIL